MAILVTGGAGYIGSHTLVELLDRGYEVVVVDNLSNSSKESLKRVKEITGKNITFYEVDLLDKEKMEEIFKKEKIEAVIHFAGLKAVGESVSKPIEYYHNNITGTLVLCELMKKYNVKNLVFSSSATVYGKSEKVPLIEESPLSTTNPYGSTKLMLEQILKDLHVSDPEWNIVILRYFNPIGAHHSGLIGEDPKGIPNNLVPYITKVIVGKLPHVNVFGNDYDTIDGTGVRDYIHVVDLSIGHVKAVEKLKEKKGYLVYNLGTGTGYSVLEMIKSFEEVIGRKIPIKICERRPGDIAVSYADASKAKEELGFIATKNLSDMCKDSIRWQSNNPNGYSK